MVHVWAFLRRLGTGARASQLQASKTNRDLAVGTRAVDSLIHGLPLAEHE